ncbi:MAG TPA: hypothetical protein VM848_04725 [Acidimicrobiia bacterium]|nr:hypothetical protein [Acidimicrobiia bacterium]
MTRPLRIARSAATAYTVTFVAGSYLSIKRGYPARALGLDMGSDVRRSVLGGVHGAGLAAPWNLVVQMWLSLGLAPRADANGRRARAWLAFLSALFVAGAVSEPVSHRIVTRDLPPADTVVAVANIVLPILMLVAALASLVDGEGECS